jgi:hypothetical protein
VNPTLPAANLLADSTSPYLIQHAGNPVHWRPWGPAALAEAAATGKPILLSVGYAACHWCHVMAHESFEDEAVAAVMNRLYVNIKVDREERPDIDQIYMAALHALGEQGGWPLTMFLTPDGGPIWGGTYFPKEPRYGRPGFVQLLESIAAFVRDKPDQVAANRAALTDAIRARATEAAPLTRGLIDSAAERLLGIMDKDLGGPRGAPKFPNPPLLQLLWRAGGRTGEPDYRASVLLTLRRMSQGGIYDHLGGGFARYSVDDRWLVPHFEKMLYDNAQLLDLLALAFAETRDPLFRERIEETVGWIAREMTTPEGGFASSLDADSEGHEGRFYVWSEAEIEDALGEGARDFCRAYDVTARGNWEGVSILNRSHRPARLDDVAEATLAGQRQRLLDRRASRIRPGLDDKVLADWTAMTIAALARAGTSLDRPDWLEMARRAYGFVTGAMTRGDRIGHSWRAGRLVFPGLSSDAAAMIGAALALHRATLDPAYLADARRFAAALDRHHWDAAEGGYYLTASDAEALIVRPKSPLDEAVPNPNGVMAEQLVRLWILTGEDAWRERADRLLAAFSGELPRNVFATASLFNALDTRLEPVELVIVAPPGTDALPLVRIASESTNLRLVALVVDGAAALPAGHPAEGRAAVDGRATAYLCRGGTCSLPVTTPEALAGLIGRAAH